jgi:site-specific DNA-methyltransferase (adenine-specific)
MESSFLIMKPWKNQLYFGDNLEILRDEIPDEFVDLIYLDPPFNSNASYNVLFAEKSGEKSAAQIAAFEDTWEWSAESQAAYSDLVLKGNKLAELVSSLRSFLGTNNMMAYIVMMAVRLVELRRVLKSTGSIYLHCDPNGQPLPETGDGRNLRNRVFPKRNHLEALPCSQRFQARLTTLR